MSHIYRIGDRVRLARPNYPENLNHEGTIRCFVPEGRGYLGRKFNCRIDWDAKSLNGCTDHSHTDQLEPILPKSLPAEIIAMTGLPDFQIAAGECA